MLRRLGLLLSALAMFAIAGGHWAVLQSVAWAGMVSDYSRSGGLGVAVQKTFSGEYPCAMCKRVAEAQKNEEQKTPALKADKKAETFLAAAASAALFPPPPSWLLAIPTDRPPAAVTFDPPQPVPRLA